MLWMSDKIAVGNRPLEKGNWRQALFVGLIQLIAVMPGISRSGSTITGGLFAGFSKKDAVRFSFLLSIPAILGANILKLPELIGDPSFSANALPYLCGVLAAALSGFAAIKLLQYISSAKKLSVFSVYWKAVGLAAIIYWCRGIAIPTKGRLNIFENNCKKNNSEKKRNYRRQIRCEKK